MFRVIAMLTACRTSQFYCYFGDTGPDGNTINPFDIWNSFVEYIIGKEKIASINRYLCNDYHICLVWSVILLKNRTPSLIAMKILLFTINIHPNG